MNSEAESVEAVLLLQHSDQPLIMPNTEQQWRAHMEDSGFRKDFFKMKNLHVKLTLCESRAWLLYVLLLRKLLP